MDFVILDTPPATGLADALIAAQSADATLLVIGSDIVSERDAIRAKELLAASPASIVGAVLNRTDELPGALTYAHYYSRRQASPATMDGQAVVTQDGASVFAVWRDRLVNFILPRKYS